MKRRTQKKRNTIPKKRTVRKVDRTRRKQRVSNKRNSKKFVTDLCLNALPKVLVKIEKLKILLLKI